jgi:anti-sigma B factor antagonist/stage II sporulation protein AA (anti-sigma F factor antagonist)
VSKPVVELIVVDGRPHIRGECDLSPAAHIEKWLATFPATTLEVDLSGVTFIDSSGLKAFLNARRRNDKMRMVAPSAAVVRLLAITGTTDLFVDGHGAAG